MKKPSKDQIVTELKKRLRPNLVLEKALFDKQLGFVNDVNPFRVAITSRRSGKTVSCGVDLVYTATNSPEVVCLYITLSRSSAKKLIWPEIKRICRTYEISGKFNEADLSVEFENGSIIYCSGASDKSEIEKFRGLAIKKVYVDECQSFPSYIEDLVNDVLSPALMDYAGSLSLIGTPGPIPSGFFFDCSRNPNWSSHNWTFWDNPFIASKSNKTHQELFDRELKRRGVDKSDPSIQREWFGQWMLDIDSLVFKYNKEKNDYVDAPHGINNYIMGIDLGYDDADAICVLGWSDKSSTTYLVEEKITKHQGLTELVEQIEAMRKRYDFTKIVMDTAGLGKKISEEVIRRYKINVIPAEKSRKLEYIELLNDSLRTGDLRAKESSRFAEDCLKVEWDMDKSTPDKKRVSDRFHSDICDAVLYAWRESYSYTHDKTPTKQAPKWGSPEWAKEEQDKMEEEAEKHFKELEDAQRDPYY